MQQTVYFMPIARVRESGMSEAARLMLETVVSRQNIRLEREIPLKIHTGEPGNTAFLKPAVFDGIIGFLESRGITATFTETNTAAGIRSSGPSHREVARDHGFVRIPFAVADGDDGFGHTEIPVPGCPYFSSCKIASGLEKYSQVIVLSHFKGHVMSGFGGALKMLALGFASGRGKTELHAKAAIPETKKIDWSKAGHDEAGVRVWNDGYVYSGAEFRQRMSWYALAACRGKRHIHLLFAVNIVPNCDCDGYAMENQYGDLGIFASTDPVAIDRACFDLLSAREGKPAFSGDDIFAYAESIGVGSASYRIEEV